MRVLHLNCKGSNFIAARTQKDDKLNLAKLRRGSRPMQETASSQRAHVGVSYVSWRDTVRRTYRQHGRCKRYLLDVEMCKGQNAADGPDKPSRVRLVNKGPYFKTRGLPSGSHLMSCRIPAYSAAVHCPNTLREIQNDPHVCAPSSSSLRNLEASL
jgi:hypothetical protein